MYVSQIELQEISRIFVGYLVQSIYCLTQSGVNKYVWNLEFPDVLLEVSHVGFQQNLWCGV